MKRKFLPGMGGEEKSLPVIQANFLKSKEKFLLGNLEPLALGLLRRKSKPWNPCFYPSLLLLISPRAFPSRMPLRALGISPKFWQNNISRKGIHLRKTRKAPLETQRLRRWPIIS
jgi:hypothetical protein